MTVTTQGVELLLRGRRVPASVTVDQGLNPGSWDTGSGQRAAAGGGSVQLYKFSNKTLTLCQSGAC